MENKKINSDFLQNMPVGWEFVSAECSGLTFDSYELINTPYFIQLQGGDKFCLSSFVGVSFEHHESFSDLKPAMRSGERRAFETMGATGMNQHTD